MNWNTGKPISSHPEAWYWVWDGEDVRLAAYDIGFANGWGNYDCWEDFQNEVTHWWGPLVKPEPPK